MAKALKTLEFLLEIDTREQKTKQGYAEKVKEATYHAMRHLADHKLEAADWRIQWDDTYIDEVKIDEDWLSSANQSKDTGNLYEEFQNMLLYTKEQEELGITVHNYCSVIFTDKYLNEHPREALIAYKRIGLMKHKYPWITFKHTLSAWWKDGTLKYDAIENAMRWFINRARGKTPPKVTLPDVTAEQVRIWQQKGAAVAIASSTKRWTVEKAHMILDEFEDLQGVCNARQIEIENVLRAHGIVTAEADSMDLYEMIHESFPRELDLVEEPQEPKSRVKKKTSRAMEMTKR